MRERRRKGPISGTAVPKYGPREILPPVGAISKHPARLCRPSRHASRSHPRGKPGFSTLESGCGRETDCLLEGAGFEPSVPRQESRRFEPASVPSRVGRCRRGGYGPGGDRRPDRAVEIADRRWCAFEPPLESRIKPSRRVGPSRGTDGSNPSPSSGESDANLSSCARPRGRRHIVSVVSLTGDRADAEAQV
jgi:hypothetical protein